MNEPKVKKNKSCFEGVLSVRNEQATNEKEAKRHKYCILKKYFRFYSISRLLDPKKIADLT